MRRYLFDTGIAGDFIDKRRGVDKYADTVTRRGDRIGIGVPVLGELYGGVENSATRQRNWDRLRHSLSRLTIWPFDIKAAEEYGRIFAALRRMGRPIQQIDMQIAAIALSLGNCTVVTRDSDLSAVPGLAVENWSTP